MRTKTMYALIIIATLAFCLTVSQPAIASDEEEVLQVAENFAKAMNDSDIDLMRSLWLNSPDTSTFGPPKVLAFLTQGWDEMMSFFDGMMSYPAGTYLRTMHNPKVVMLGGNAAILTAYSVFTQNPPAVPEQTISQERSTFVLQKIDGKWLIVHAHGSILPTE